jgi:hypothetical protein
MLNSSRTKEFFDFLTHRLRCEMEMEIAAFGKSYSICSKILEVMV